MTLLRRLARFVEDLKTFHLIKDSDEISLENVTKGKINFKIRLVLLENESDEKFKKRMELILEFAEHEFNDLIIQDGFTKSSAIVMLLKHR